ncbi:MAG: PAS domain-containing protein, partial [Chloroflexi bacterium]|nr:PAS domain-containing protein [Chloroflexota bacterium]
MVELSRANEWLTAEILERKKVEQALWESEEQLRLALEAACMGIWNWNILTGAMTMSSQVETIFGLAAGEFAGTYEAYLDLVHPADRAIVEQNIAETLAGARADYHVEHRFVWPDGSMHWLEGKGRVYRDEAARPVRMTGTVADITVRKQTEIALQESQAFLHNLYTGGGMAIFVVDVAA